MFTPAGGNYFMSFQLGNIDKSPYDIRQYWTPERRLAAIPEPMSIEPGEEYVPEDIVAAPATEPRQADIGIMPFTAGGKLFYTMDGVDYVGSGNIFMHNNMLLIAAHCVQNKQTGNLGENFLFERCYSGEKTAEDFTFKTIALKENWYLTKSVNYDYAIVILNKNSELATPLRYSTDPNLIGKLATAFGYPTNYYGGRQMMYVVGQIAPKTGHWVMVGNKLGPGASGGAWVLEDNETAVGLNSYAAFSKKEIVYVGSPRFDAEFEGLYQYALTLM